MSIQTIYVQLVSAGMSAAGACGMLGNMQAESGMMSNNVEDRSGLDDSEYTAKVDAGGYDFITDNGGRYGYGLCQWTYGPRKKKLLEFAKSRGVSIGDEQMQVDFALWELHTEPEYAELWAYLRSAKGVAEAAGRVCREYEKPEVNNIKARAAYANQFFMALGGMAVTPAAPDTEPITAAAYWPPRSLEYGMSGPDVVALQGLLIAHGYPAGVSGQYDNATRLKTMEFQAENGLYGDGIAGPKTWTALCKR